MERTRHYGLPLFEGSDKPSILVDWNQTMNDIDNAMFQIATGGDSSVIDAITALQQGLDSVNTQIGVINTELDDKLDTTFLNNIAPEFDSTSTYQMYDMVFNEGNLYMCAFPYSSGDVFDQCFTPIWLGNKVTDLINENQTQAGQISALDGRVTALENSQPTPQAFTMPAKMDMKTFTETYCDKVGSTQNISFPITMTLYPSSNASFAGPVVTFSSKVIRLEDFFDPMALDNELLLFNVRFTGANNAVIMYHAGSTKPYSIPAANEVQLFNPELNTRYGSAIGLLELGKMKFQNIRHSVVNSGNTETRMDIVPMDLSEQYLLFEGVGNQVYRCNSLMPFTYGYSGQGIFIPSVTTKHFDVMTSDGSDVQVTGTSRPYTISSNWDGTQNYIKVDIYKIKSDYKSHFVGYGVNL